ncbi:hypothetical protein F190043G2_30980 [Blautia caecimuris]
MLYDNIKELCLEKKIAISEMERDLGFPRSYVCKWNENEPGIRKVQKSLFSVSQTAHLLYHIFFCLSRTFFKFFQTFSMFF